MTGAPARRQFGNALRRSWEDHETNNIGWLERLTHDLRAADVPHVVLTLVMLATAGGMALALGRVGIYGVNPLRLTR